MRNRWGIVRIKARVEHVLGAIVQMGGKLIRTIGQTRTNFAITLMSACNNIQRLVFMRRTEARAF